MTRLRMRLWIPWRSVPKRSQQARGVFEITATRHNSIALTREAREAVMSHDRRQTATGTGHRSIYCLRQYLLPPAPPRWCGRRRSLGSQEAREEERMRSVYA